MTDIEKLAAERLKGLQSKEREVKELKRELEREKAINDAMVEANRTGRQSLIKFNQRLVLSQEQAIEAQGRIGELQTEIDELKDTIDYQDRQLKEAHEAAARADKTAEGRHRACEALERVVDQQRKKIRKQEQTIQTLENALSREQDMAARLRVGDPVHRLEAKRKLLQRMKDDLLAVRSYDSYMLVSDFIEAMDRYRGEIEEGLDP